MINDLKRNMLIMNEKLGISVEELNEKEPNKNSRKVQYLLFLLKSGNDRVNKLKDRTINRNYLV